MDSVRVDNYGLIEIVLAPKIRNNIILNAGLDSEKNAAPHFFNIDVFYELLRLRYNAVPKKISIYGNV